MKKYLATICVGLPALMLSAPTFANEYNINVMVAESRTYSNTAFWGFLNKEPAGLIVFDYADEGWPANVEVGFANTNEKFWFTTTINGNLITANGTFTVTELFGGVRKFWDMNGFRPSLGAGLTSVNFTGNETTNLGTAPTTNSSSLGFYVDGCVCGRIGEHFNIGLDWRMVSGTSINAWGASGDVDYTQYGILLGYGW